jgi:hypothetical protein
MTLYSLINRGMYKHMDGVRGEGIPSRVRAVAPAVTQCHERVVCLIVVLV